MIVATQSKHIVSLLPGMNRRPNLTSLSSWSVPHLAQVGGQLEQKKRVNDSPKNSGAPVHRNRRIDKVTIKSKHTQMGVRTEHNNMHGKSINIAWTNTVLTSVKCIIMHGRKARYVCIFTLEVDGCLLLARSIQGFLVPSTWMAIDVAMLLAAAASNKASTWTNDKWWDRIEVNAFSIIHSMLVFGSCRYIW